MDNQHLTGPQMATDFAVKIHHLVQRVARSRNTSLSRALWLRKTSWVISMGRQPPVAVRPWRSRSPTTLRAALTISVNRGPAMGGGSPN